MRVALRRLGATASTVALAGFGLAAGLALSGPAGAQGADDIQISMSGTNGFTDGPTPPLLDVADLAPGGSVTGVMWVRNNSGHSGDLSLTLTATGTGSRCTAGSGPCEALAQQLALSLTVSGQHCPAASVWNGSVAGLRDVPLATGLGARHACRVVMTAALPQSVDNAVQYGGMAFDLQLALAPVNNGGNSNGGGGNAGGGGGNNGGTGNNGGGHHGGGGGHGTGHGGHGGQGIGGVITHHVGPGGHSGGRGVLGITTHRLASTGTPVLALGLCAVMLFAGGLVMLVLARRTRPSDDRR